MKDRDIMEVSAEVHFAHKLASNEKKYRDRALKRLQKFLTIRSTQGDGMSNDDFIKIWKGLHYCMWMQDKPLMQEELSQRIANLLHSFPRLSDSLRFVNVFLITEAREWQLIDRFRIDKFMMLIRDILHEIFLMMSESGWPLSACEAFSQYLANSVMNEDNPKLPDGLKLHMADIFMPELRKVSLEKMTGKKMTILMFPFAAFILKTRKLNLASKVVSQTITPVLRRFGSWPKQSISNKGMPQNSSEAAKSQAEEEDPDEEEGMEYEDEDQEEEGEEDMEGTENKKDQKYDMTRLLKLMFKMADNKKVHHKNRAMFYKIVQGYSSADGSFLPSESKHVTRSEGNGNVDENDDEDDARDESSTESSTQTILNLCWPDGQEEAPKKKRKRKKKHSEVEARLKTNDEGKVEAVDKRVDASGDKNKKKPVKGTKDGVDLNPSGPGKKRRRDSEDFKSSEVNLSKPCGQGKKRRRNSEDLEGSEINLSKRARLNDPKSPGGGSPPNLNTALKEQKGKKLAKNGSNLKTPRKSEKRSLSPKDKNFNAGSHIEIMGGNLTLYSTVEIAKYSRTESKAEDENTLPVAPPPKPASPPATAQQDGEMNSMTESISLSKPSTTDSSDSLAVSSMSDIKVFMPTSIEWGGKVAKTKKKKKKSPAQVSVAEMEGGAGKEEVNEEKAGQGLLSVLTTPSNLVQKAMAMVLPASDPGPAKEKILKEDDTLTPGTKKKVVFDLRKNKANKFRDYIKSLNSDSPPVFEPHKSPSQSILKSPLPSPNSSSISLDVDSDSETRPKKKGAKRTGASGNKKGRGASQSPPASRKRSPKTSRKKSKSPKRK